MSEVTQELIEQRLRQFADVCRRRGLKVTRQRLEIFRELASTDAHPTAEEIFNRVRLQLPLVSLDIRTWPSPSRPSEFWLHLQSDMDSAHLGHILPSLVEKTIPKSLSIDSFISDIVTQ